MRILKETLRVPIDHLMNNYSRISEKLKLNVHYFVCFKNTTLYIRRIFLHETVNQRRGEASLKVPEEQFNNYLSLRRI